MCELVFPARFPHYAWTAQSAHSDFVGSRVYAFLSVPCHLHFLSEWPGPFTCHCGNMEMERTPNKIQHRNLTVEKNIFPSLLPGFDSQPFDHESGILTSNQVINKMHQTLDLSRTVARTPATEPHTHTHTAYLIFEGKVLVSATFWRREMSEEI